MILKKPNSRIKVYDYMLNSLLDEGVFFRSKKQMDHFIYRYLKKNKIKNVKRKYTYITDNKKEFINFIQNKLYK